MIKILNKHHLGCVPKDTIYAGRGSVFGNPFTISPTQDRDKVCDMYKDYFYKEIQKRNSPLRKAVDELISYDKPDTVTKLVCFCAPKRCHLETIKDYVESVMPL